jgi:hypothetical protein
LVLWGSVSSNGLTYQVVEEQVVRVAKAVEEQLDDQIARLDNLKDDDLDKLREQRMRQYKLQAEKKKQWAALGHGEYQEIMVEKEFFSLVKQSDRVVAHFYRENWPCKVSSILALLTS